MTSQTSAPSSSYFAAAECLKPILLGLTAIAIFIAGVGGVLENWQTLMNAITGHDRFFWTPLIVSSGLMSCGLWAICAHKKLLLSARLMATIVIVTTAPFVLINVAVLRSPLAEDSLSYYRGIAGIIFGVASFFASFLSIDIGLDTLLNPPRRPEPTDAESEGQ